MPKMIQRLGRIGRNIGLIASLKGQQHQPDEIEIVIRVPLNRAHGLDEHNPKGTVTLYTNSYGNGHEVPTQRHHHYIGDVFDNFDLQGYVEDYERVVKSILNDERNK